LNIIFGLIELVKDDIGVLIFVQTTNSILYCFGNKFWW